MSKSAIKLQKISSSILLGFSVVASIFMIIIDISAESNIEDFEFYIFTKVVYPLIASGLMLFFALKTKENLIKKDFDKLKRLVTTNIIVILFGFFSPVLLFNPEMKVAKILAIAVAVMFIVCIVHYAKSYKEIKNNIEKHKE